MIAGRLLCVAPQSDMTNPAKPHCLRKMSVSSWVFSDAHVPFTLLYEHITEPAPAFTAASNPCSSISCIVRSSTSALTELRWFSWLFSAKCLTVAMRPAP